jgi:hypothetical protein
MLDGHDLVAHHRAHGGNQRANFVGDAEIHVFLPRVLQAYGAEWPASASRVTASRA